MLRLALDSQYGRLTLSEEDGSIVALTWGGHAMGKPSPVLAEAKQQLLEYFAGRRKQFDLPHKLDGPPAALGVWHLMEEIPYGETRSYGDLGKALGISPRVVGRFCGLNPLPIIVPCHRVVGSDGTLVGYSGGEGAETKRRLLQLEHALLL